MKPLSIGSFGSARTGEGGDSNQAPTGIALSTTVVDESVAPGTVVATISGTDPENDALTFSLASGIVTDGLFLHADAGSASSYSGTGATWGDLSGNGNDLTLNGVSDWDFTEGFYLAGNTSSYIGKSNFSIPEVLTTEVWYKTTKGLSGIVCYATGSGEATKRSLVIYRPSALRYYYQGSSTNYFYDELGLNTSDGEWHQLVVSEDRVNATVRYYLDGTLSGTITQNAEVSTNARTQGGFLSIGQTQLSPGSFYGPEAFQGRMAIVRMYNKVLTDAEVAQNFNFDRVRFEKAGWTGGYGDSTLFTVDGTSLKINGSPNFQLKPSYDIELIASDGVSTYEEAFTLTVNEPTPGIVETDLVSWLDAGNSSSYPGTGSTWVDLSGNGNDGSLENGWVYDPANSGGFDLPGNARVRLPSFSFSNTSPWAFSLWVRINTRNITYPSIFVRDAQASFAGFSATTFLVFYTTSLVFKTNNEQISIPKPADGQIFNYVVSHDGTGALKIYVDGVLAQDRSLYGDCTGSPSFIGYDGDINTYHFLKYDKALSPAEVDHNFNVLRGRYGV